MLPILIATSVILGAVLAYLLWVRDWDHWAKKGVPSPKPSFPYGNVKPIFDGKKTFGDFFDDIIKEWPEEPVIGFYSFFKPMLLLNDPDIINSVVVTNFPKFVDGAFELSSADSLFLNTSFWLKGHKAWKEAKSRFTPSFTSSKQKSMVPTMIDSVQRHFNYALSQKGTDPAEVFQAIKLMLNDSILRIAFSIEVDLIKEAKDADSQYKQLLDGDLFVDRQDIHLLFCTSHLASWYFKIRKLRLMSEERHNFYVEFINSCVEARKKSLEQRNDILQSIIAVEKEAVSEGKRAFTREEWASNMLTVMVDSTETAALVLKFILFAVAQNTKEQEKLRSELLKAGSSITDFDYDKIATIRRLDMVINESLRLYSPVLALGKICVETTKIGDVVVEKGTKVFIPISSLHMNPKYHEDPTKFNPERFEDMKSIRSCTFMPFGEGPRACLGQRYALLVLKVLLVQILLTYEVSLEDGYEGPLEFNKMSPFIAALKEEPKWKFTMLK
ncbi:cytochrome P450 [Nesidiocoris tenuis]|uniref:Cytochrome P450 n=1 Tax=Nesidiocoris tenuis TaxID=355587 RepID=A0ABN7B614_9HEMI|nr:cytochrome P450 [Nesidiocoris tenuis]